MFGEEKELGSSVGMVRKEEQVKSNGIFWYGYSTIKQAGKADKGTREAGGNELMSVAQDGGRGGSYLPASNPQCLGRKWQSCSGHSEAPRCPEAASTRMTSVIKHWQQRQHWSRPWPSVVTIAMCCNKPCSQVMSCHLCVCDCVSSANNARNWMHESVSECSSLGM